MNRKRRLGRTPGDFSENLLHKPEFFVSSFYWFIHPLSNYHHMQIKINAHILPNARALSWFIEQGNQYGTRNANGEHTNQTTDWCKGQLQNGFCGANRTTKLAHTDKKITPKLVRNWNYEGEIFCNKLIKSGFFPTAFSAKNSCFISYGTVESDFL